MTRFSAEHDRVAVVETGARLHLGFYRPCLRGGWVLGGVGAGVDGAGFRVAAGVGGEGLRVEGCQAERAMEALRAAAGWLGLRAAWLRVEECIPSHVGLGSTTQLWLAVYAALAALASRRVEDAVKAAGRFRLSAVGAGVFLWGGLVADTGLRGGKPGTVRPMLRLSLPEDWRVVAVLPDVKWRVEEAAAEEEAVIRAALASRGEYCERASRALVDMVLPGAAAGDLELFARGLEEVEEATALAFSASQPGGRYCCPETARAVEELRRSGAVGVGQSSWGPLAYGWAGSPEDAERIAARLSSRLPRGWRLLLLRPRNRGAVLQVAPQAPRG